jgi:hypothetical protein
LEVREMAQKELDHAASEELKKLADLLQGNGYELHELRIGSGSTEFKESFGIFLTASVVKHSPKAT